jgi:hypothetical protein
VVGYVGRADRAEEDGVELLQLLETAFGNVRAGFLVAVRAPVEVLELEPDPELLQHLDARRDDFIADPVTRDRAIRYDFIDGILIGRRDEDDSCVLAVLSFPVLAGDIDRSIADFKTPEQIKWVRNAAGTNEQAVLFGDPSKEGPYVVRLRWLKGNMSRPAFPPARPLLVVVKGTWWSDGRQVRSRSTVPVRPWHATSSTVREEDPLTTASRRRRGTARIQVWAWATATSTLGASECSRLISDQPVCARAFGVELVLSPS